MVGRIITALIMVWLVNATNVVSADYLNFQTMTVSLGPSMTAEPFNNRTAAASLASIIDAPSASAGELHTQTTHVWTTNKPLELNFDLQTAYDLTTMHLWNYFTETYDVDDIDFKFYNAANELVGSLLNISPATGGPGSSDSVPILAQNLNLSFPHAVRYVNAVLTGSNGEVDFNNLGFTGTLTSPTVPGDYDFDGDVDGADFVVWQTTFPNPPLTPGAGDGDNDGDCDGADFVIWQTNFPYNPALAVVPEPSTIALALLSVPAIFALRRRLR